MFPTNYVLAIGLLISPGDGQDLPNHDIPGVRPALQKIAMDWEIMDPREDRYLLIRSEDFRADLGLLRRRYQDLKDAPPACDCQRFPPTRTCINEAMAYNRAYRAHVEDRRCLGPSRWGDLHDIIAEVDQLYQIYDLVRDSRSEYYYVTVRRDALKRLRSKIGPEAYYAGCLPAPVPVWRFAQMD